MPLGVLGDVNQQADHGRGKLLASHAARLAEGGRVERAHDRLGVIKGSLDERQQFVAADAGGVALRLQGRKLSGVQRLSLQIAMRRPVLPAMWRMWNPTEPKP